MSIKFYKTREAHGFMSNYYKARFFIYGRWWPSVEHPYQAKKCTESSDYDTIWQTIKSNDARDLGQKVAVRVDWNEVKSEVMYECVLAKFLQHKDLREQLLATGDVELVEDSPVDWYWGCGADGTGQNMLGQILMRVRSELKSE